jgi:hypothetical protein
MAIALVGSSIGSTTSGTSVSALVPAGQVAGNLLIACLNQGADGVTVTPPAGWTLLAGNYRTYAYYKLATAADSGSYAFGLSPAAASALSVSAFSTADVIGSVNTFNFPAVLSTNIVGTSISPTTKGILIFLAATRALNAAITTPAGMTATAAVQAGSVPSQTLFYQQINAGATGDRTATTSSNYQSGMMISINENVRTLSLNATLDSVGLAASIMQASTLALNATLDSVGLAARVNLLYPPTLTLNATLDSVGLTASIKQATTLSLNATLDSVGLTAQLKVLSIYEKISWAAGASDASPMPVPTYQVMRLIDNYLLDHADKLFKVSGWTTVSKSMPRVLASPIPVFQDNLDTSLFIGDYLFIPYSPGTTSKPSSYQATYSSGVRLTGGLTFSDIAQLNSVASQSQNIQSRLPIMLTAGGLLMSDAPSAATIINTLGTRLYDGIYTGDQIFRIHDALLNGRVTNAGTGVEWFWNREGTKVRVKVTVDLNGNRTNIEVVDVT